MVHTYFASSHLIPPTFTTTGISPPATTGSDDKDFPGQEEGREVSFKKILIIIIIVMMTMTMMMVIKMMTMMMVVMMMVIITSFSPFLTGPLWCRPRVALPDDDNGHRYHHDHQDHYHEHYNHSMMEQ